MAKKKVTMLSTAAGPNFILHEGKTYLLDAELADVFLKAGAGKTPHDAAAAVAKPGAKLSKVDPKPDPGEKDEPEDTDDDNEVSV